MRELTNSNAFRMALVLLAVLLHGADASADWTTIKGTFKKHCVACHGSETQEGEVRLDTLTLDVANEENLETLWDIRDQLAMVSMPPEDEPQPSAEERARIVEFLDNFLANVEENRLGGSDPTVLRRLTRVQYRNTLRDLLGVNVTQDPTASFPGDAADHGFDTNAETLRVSNYLMNSYMEAADWALTTVTREGPRPKTMRVAAKFEGLGGAAGADGIADLYSGSQQARSLANFKFLWRQLAKRFEPPVGGGRLRLTITAESLNRQIPDPELRKRFAMSGYDGDLPFALGVYLLTGSKETAKAEMVKAFDLPDGRRVTETIEVWVPNEYTLAFGFLNGPDIKKIHHIIPSMAGLTDSRKEPYKKAIVAAQIPKIRLHEVLIEGPIHDQWPPASHVAIYGDQLTNQQVVSQFANRAFRRPVSESTLQPFRELAGSGNDPDSLRKALVAVLCSPPFIYFDEKPGRLDDYAIASRLSYFLWSSMPDEALLDLAAEGRLRDPSVIVAQMNRMLADPRSSALTDEFVAQWLDFSNIVEMPPMGQEFKSFYSLNLHEAMLGETKRFFRELLEKNLPVRNLIDSDFTFLNANLAHHYGIDANVGHELERVSLVNQPGRGGLLGQGAILTASANGVETSPVTRGVWVLENLFGTPPPPPPPDVPAASPDIRGALTVREILAKHRTDAACNSCHKKIDPHGFALESFDPIGRWRDAYPNGQAIQVDGEIDGRSFNGIDEMKAVLLAKESVVARGLATKLLEYGTGRQMGPRDRAEIHRLIKDLENRDYGMRDMFELVVTSSIFLTK